MDVDLSQYKPVFSYSGPIEPADISPATKRYLASSYRKTLQYRGSDSSTIVFTDPAGRRRPGTSHAISQPKEGEILVVDTTAFSEEPLSRVTDVAEERPGYICGVELTSSSKPDEALRTGVIFTQCAAGVRRIWVPEFPELSHDVQSVQQELKGYIREIGKQISLTASSQEGSELLALLSRQETHQAAAAYYNRHVQMVAERVLTQQGRSDLSILAVGSTLGTD